VRRKRRVTVEGVRGGGVAEIGAGTIVEGSWLAGAVSADEEAEGRM